MWLHVVEKFALKRFKNLTLRSPLACRSSGLSSSSVTARWAATLSCRTEMVKYELTKCRIYAESNLLNVALIPDYNYREALYFVTGSVF